MTFLINRCRRRSYLVEELVDTLRDEHRDAIRACDVEEAVAECLELGELLQHAWAVARDVLFDGRDEQLEDMDGFREAVVSTLDRAIGVLPRVRKTAEQSMTQGYDVKRFGEFSKAFDILRALRADIDATWPAVDSQRIADSIASYHRGDHRSAEELLRDARG